MTYEGNVYTVTDDTWGNLTITRQHDSANCFLQGEEANELRASILQCEDFTYPIGPFQNFAQQLDALLDQYESIIR